MQDGSRADFDGDPALSLRADPGMLEGHGFAVEYVRVGAI
jgi:hypothetical protein